MNKFWVISFPLHPYFSSAFCVLLLFIRTFFCMNLWSRSRRCGKPKSTHAPTISHYFKFYFSVSNKFNLGGKKKGIFCSALCPSSTGSILNLSLFSLFSLPRRIEHFVIIIWGVEVWCDLCHSTNFCAINKISSH